jgi:aspartate/methionine/tyrosine aminotransferase
MPRSGVREIGDFADTLPGIIKLHIGEPDANTAPHIIEAAARAARSGHTHYAPNAGIPELREACAAKVARVNAIAASPLEIVVTPGAVTAIYSTLAAVLVPGDHVLLPDPGWPNYAMMTTTLGAMSTGYPVDATTGEIDIGELERLVTPRTRVIVVNTPSNPTGARVPRRVLQRLYTFAEEHDLWIIADDVYDQIVYDGEVVSAGGLEDRPTRVVSVFSFSKTYAMTGWRVGYLVAPPQLADLVAKLQEPVVSCVNTPAQHAALAALEGPQDEVALSVARYSARSNLAVDLLRVGGVTVAHPGGGFYLWLPVEPRDGDAAARELVTAHGVAVAPGGTFGVRGRQAVRLSLAAAEEDIREGIARILGSGLLT